MTNAAIAKERGVSIHVLKEWKWALRNCPRLSHIDANNPEALDFYQALVTRMGFTKAKNYLIREF